MKPTNATLNAILASRQFVTVDLYQITLRNGTVLRYNSGQVDVSYNGNVYSAGGEIGPYFDRRDAKAKVTWRIGPGNDKLTIDVAPGAATINGVSWLKAGWAGWFDAADFQLYRAFIPQIGVAPVIPAGFTAQPGFIGILGQAPLLLAALPNSMFAQTWQTSVIGQPMFANWKALTRGTTLFINGQSASFGLRLLGQNTALLINGQTATFKISMTAATGSIVVTGEATTLIKVVSGSIATVNGTLAITGQAALFRLRMPNQFASISVNGQTATLATKMPAQNGVVSVSGQTATLSQATANALTLGPQPLFLGSEQLIMPTNIAVSLQTASAIVVTGKDTTLRIKMPAQNASVSIIGQVPTFKHFTPLAAARGSVAITGKDSTLKVSMPAQQGTVAISGQVNTLTKLSVRTILGNQASVTVTALTATFVVKMTGATGTLAITGEAVTFLLTMPNQPGTLNITGQPATFTRTSGQSIAEPLGMP